ncbi:MAG: hypothetical protein RLZZ450_6297 [Pseudomonadota bacterium]|jgi:hypothetical protein
MSRVEKLKALLAKVERRRAEPRLVAVSGGHSLSSANTNLAAPAVAKREAPLELARPPAPVQAQPESLSLESLAPPPSSIPPPSVHEAETKLRSSLPPPHTALRAPLAAGPSSTVPPAATPIERPAARSTTEVLPAAPTRIAPSPALPFDSAVVVTSSPRLDTPKTFGELLEQSLALRPKSG